MGTQNHGGILKTDLKVILALCLVHFCGDFYQSFIKPLLPALVERYSLTLAEVGLITGVNTFLAFLVQPSVGYLADHYRTRFFVVGGALLSALFVPLMGLAPGFGFLLVCVGLGSVGSAMFHPTAAGMVSTYAGAHSGLSMSLFGLGGTLAFTVGPLLATVYVTAFGLTFLPLTSIFGVAAFFLLLTLVPKPESEGLGQHGFWGSLKQSLGGVWKAIGLIWLLTVIRSFVDQSLSTFIPILYAAEGHSLISTG
ncbi:MAG: MFS transporter, partial [Thermodesulfobacteriota bacterium]